MSIKSIKSFKNFVTKNTKVLVASLVTTAIGATSFISVSALSRDYNIVDGNNIFKVTILGNEAYKAIEKAGITLNEKDKVVIDESDPRITNVDIKRAFNVNLRFGNENYQIQTTEGTVKDVLEQANVSLGANDIIDTPLDQTVSPELNINVDKVEFKDFTENQEIPFITVTRKSSELFKGDSKTENGENGIKVITKQEKYVNGVLAESNQVSETVAKPAKNQVKIVGTKTHKNSKPSNVVPANQNTLVESNGVLIDANGNEVKFKKALRGVCTTYYGANTKLEGGPRTCTGEKVGRGVIAADLRKFPIGTKFYIPGYGYGVVKDTGGAVRAGKILLDLGCNSYADCQTFGKRTTIVYML